MIAISAILQFLITRFVTSVARRLPVSTTFLYKNQVQQSRDIISTRIPNGTGAKLDNLCVSYCAFYQRFQVSIVAAYPRGRTDVQRL